MDAPLRTLNALIARALKFVITVLIAVMVIPVTLQIFSRFFEFIPRYIWTEEVARFCLMWLIMLGATIAVRDGTHFDVDVLPEPKTVRGKAVARLVPMEEPKAPDRARAVRSIRALSKRLNIRTRRSLRSLVEEGRD